MMAMSIGFLKVLWAIWKLSHASCDPCCCATEPDDWKPHLAEEELVEAKGQAAIEAFDRSIGHLKEAEARVGMEITRCD
jgi:hypothetical protein